MNLVEALGLVAGILMPLWNIPLVIKIWKRRSSRDLSMLWVVGIWVCIMGMLPSAIVSEDIIFKAFGIVNALLFTTVLFTALKFRNGP